MEFKNTFRRGALTCLAITVALAGCVPEEMPDPPETELGALQVALNDVDGTDIASVRIEVEASLGDDTYALVEVIELEAGSEQAGHDFVLEAGEYRVQAIPLTDGDAPSAQCTRAQALATVEAGAAVTVGLVIHCDSRETGSLRVDVDVVENPVIHTLRRFPAGPVESCRAVHLLGQAQGEDLTWTWAVETHLEAELLTGQNAARFVGLSPGDHVVRIEVASGTGSSTLRVPIRVTEGADDCLETDTDGDGIPDLVDACPLVADPDQTDADGDAIGDACTAPGGPLELTYAVDPNLTPALGQLAEDPELGIEGTRPVGRIVDQDGSVADIVMNELILVVETPDALRQFLQSHPAEVLTTIDVEVPEVHQIVAVRVQPPSITSPELVRRARKLQPFLRGTIEVSDPALLNLLGHAATASDVPGLRAGFNFLTEGHGIPQRTTTEAPTGENGYGTDAFGWEYMQRGGVQDFGAAEAWRLLRVSGRDRNRVRAAILDGGFIDEDLPQTRRTVGSGFGVANPAGCSGGNPCPWHGAMVAAAMTSVPDNNWGVAGPGGTVTDPIIVQSPNLDFLGVLHYMFVTIPRTFQTLPRIGNISAGAEIPMGAYIFTLGALDLASFAIRKAGILLFASAGNAGKDVDNQFCLFPGVCWETAAVIPCELTDVECVGGLRRGSNRRAGPSNFGSLKRGDTVDLYGPYTTWVYDPDGGTGRNHAQLAFGTSFSSPFVAGCASMVFAANPRLNADQVANILRTTSRTTSPDATVSRWTNCHEAVRQGLGGDAPPFLEITAPAPNATFRLGVDTIELRATATDHEPGPVVVRWSSNRDGNLGTGHVLQPTLSVGTHTITALTRDRSRWVASDTVEIDVVAAPLKVSVLSPLAGATYYEGNTLHMRAAAYDGANGWAKVPANAIAWELDGNPAGTGPSLSRAPFSLSVGQHSVTVTVTVGNRQEIVTSNFAIGTDPPQLPPTVWIDPLRVPEYTADVLRDGTFFAEIDVVGGGRDEIDGPLGGGLLEWLDANDEVLAYGADAVLFLPSDGEGPVTHTVRLRATDLDGASAETEVEVIVHPPR